MSDKKPRKTIVYWHVRSLAKEFGLTGQKVGTILKSLGAKRFSRSSFRYGTGPVWYCEDTDQEGET